MRNIHQSFTDALVKWLFDNFPRFADSFRLVSIHCIAQRLGANFVYKVAHRMVVPCDSTAFLSQVVKII